MNAISLVSAAAVWGKVWPILVAILFFGLIIIFHELGHFVFAKLFGVQVNEFSIGMGPAIFKKKKGETQYSLRILPIGGYVSMEGEDEDSSNERAFCNAKTWKRFIIIAAGGVINLIMGVILVAVMLGVRNDYVGTTEIVDFHENAVTAQQGLQEGDKIKKINGKTVFGEFDLSFLMARDKDGVIDFVVERNGEKVEVNGVKFETSENNGTLIIHYDFKILGLDKTFWNVIKSAIPDSISIARIVWISLFDLVTGQYGLSDLSGPIGTVTVIADTAQAAVVQTDYSSLFLMLSLIAINIGLFNLLPLPALDGGRLFFLLIEMIFRKPIPRKYEGWIHAVGLVLLLLLMVVISFSDILKLIKGQVY